MLMTEKGSLTKSTDEELDDHSTATSNATPLNELLVNSTVPAVAVAVKACEDSADENGKNNGGKQKRGILSNFQRRTFSRISFKGETGPLLSRWIYFSFFFRLYFYLLRRGFHVPLLCTPTSFQTNGKYMWRYSERIIRNK